MAAYIALKDGDCGLAPFYLGEMIHYIADVSSYCHTLKHDELGYTNHQIEGAILLRTG
jgi:hypothetical protein